MGALPAGAGLAAARVFRRGAHFVATTGERSAACRIAGCGRPLYASGLCGLHALQGHYRTVPGVGGRLAVARVERPPRIHRDDAVFDPA